MQVFYDASGYDSDDSDLERDRQSSLHLYPAGLQRSQAERPVNMEETTTDPHNDQSEINNSQKTLRQNSITQYFKKQDRFAEYGKEISIESSTGENSAAHKEDSLDERRAEVSPSAKEVDAGVPSSSKTKRKKKVSTAVSEHEGGISGLPRTPRTPRHLSFERNSEETVSEPFDQEAFFHTPQAQKKISKNLKQTPSRTAPPLGQEGTPEGPCGKRMFHTPTTKRKIPQNMKQTPSRTAPEFTQRRRSARLQAKIELLEKKANSDSKIKLVTETKEVPKRKLEAVKVRADAESCKTSEKSSPAYQKGTENNKENESISSVKLYGAETESAQKRRRSNRIGKENEMSRTLQEKVNQMDMLVVQTKGVDSESDSFVTKGKNIRDRKRKRSRKKWSCNVQKGTVDIKKVKGSKRSPLFSVNKRMEDSFSATNSLSGKKYFLLLLSRGLGGNAIFSWAKLGRKIPLVHCILAQLHGSSAKRHPTVLDLCFLTTA